MLFTRGLIDLWDPELKLRNGEKKITILQVVTLPLVIVGIFFTFSLDIITLPWQLRAIYRDE